MSKVWIGTSGWVYKQWAGNFYPRGWPKKDELGYYLTHFPTVEINATFYRLPSLAMVRGWHDRTPAGFVFAVKGSRFLTHMKRLTDTGPGLRKYFARLKPLAGRTGPILWQLAPNFRKSEETMRRLDRFLGRLPASYRHAIEFRHPSWMDNETMELLRRHRAANVWISSLHMPQDDAVTTDFVYLRFHGLRDGAYHDYTEDELEPWARRLRQAADRGLQAFVYFNNDLNTRAPLNAHALMRLVGPAAVQVAAATPLPEIAAPVPGPETWPAWQRSASPAARRPRPAAAKSRTGGPAPNGSRAAPVRRRVKDAASRSASARAARGAQPAVSKSPSRRRRPATATTG